MTDTFVKKHFHLFLFYTYFPMKKERFKNSDSSLPEGELERRSPV